MYREFCLFRPIFFIRYKNNDKKIYTHININTRPIIFQRETSEHHLQRSFERVFRTIAGESR